MGTLDAHWICLAYTVYRLCLYCIKRLLGRCSVKAATQVCPLKNWNYLRASFAPRRSPVDSILALGPYWALSPKSFVWSMRWPTCGEFRCTFPGCKYPPFVSAQSLTNHLNKYHNS